MVTLLLFNIGSVPGNEQVETLAKDASFRAYTPKLIATKDGQLHACSWGPGLSALWTVFGRLALHAMCSFFALLT
eukprot:scaffold1796_cov666-Prasinococcus_capsulatus_cf.AAC.1